MSIPSPEPNARPELRLDAEARLKENTAPSPKVWSTGANALSLLYTLASSPASADDALKLLHELQVHQVELDLLHEQVDSMQRELAEELARYRGLYEFAPVCYFDLDGEGRIVEGNVAGARLFGVALRELHGRRFESLLAPASRAVLVELLRELREGVSGLCRDVTTGAGAQGQGIPLRLIASVAPHGETFLLVVVPTAPGNRN